jgi:serine/threonine protein kinase
MLTYVVYFLLFIVDYFEDDDYYYIVMDLHGEGLDLFDYIELNREMSEHEVKSIFRQVAEAVRHLHHNKMVHRDIKDENVILDENGTALLIDFGSANYIKEGKRFDTFSGTLDYCAPEVLQGNPYEGPPQDIWSLGILLYTMIYKENPFYNIDEILARELRIPYEFCKGRCNHYERSTVVDFE